MSSYLQTILDKVQQAQKLSDEEKQFFILTIKEAQKNQKLLEFKLDRIEKDKHTLTVMLEESIQDLQKKSHAIEAQKRELEIEAALERVRTRTMAMQKSEELQDVAHMVFETLKELKVELYTAIIVVFSENSRDIFWWLENKEKYQFPKILIRYSDIPYFSELFQARQRGDEIFSKCYSGAEKREIYNYLFEQTELINTPEGQKKHLLELEIASFSIALAKNIGIHITSYSKVSFSDEENEILKKTAKVFDQAYTRFLDLQNAEAQAREAQIEAALERVRARAMAMHNSTDVTATASTVFDELKKLGISPMRCGIGLLNKENRKALWYSASRTTGEHQLSLVGWSILDDHPMLKETYDSWIRGEDYFPTLKGELLKSYFEKIRSNFEVPAEQVSSEQYGYYIAFSEGVFYGWSEKPFTESEIKIVKRFAAVIDLTFRRFFELQKAEAQARESQIELALERVRAKTMAMQKSEELPETSYLLFQQFRDLGETATQFSIGILDKEERSLELSTTFYGNEISRSFKVPIDESPTLVKIFEAWRDTQKNLVIDLSEKELIEYNDFRNRVNNFKIETKEGDRWVIHCAFFSKGMLSFSSSQPRPIETIQLLERFANVFDGTYTRFLDLKNAEAQAREAQIEAALERVRSKAMAMQNSDDLSSAVAIVFEELEKLNLGMLRCGIGIIDKASKTKQLWTTTVSDDGKKEQVIGDESMEVHVLLQGAYDAWLDQKDFSYVLEGDDLNNFYKAISQGNFKLPSSQSLTVTKGLKQYYFAAMFQAGELYAFRETPFPEEAKKVMKRFADVFSLTYTRFLDLQKAEAQARESKIESALERVRSKAMAMHKTEDLHPAVAVVFEELEKLNPGILRCGIAILDKQKPRGDIWIAIKSDAGSAIQVSGDEPMDINPLLMGAYDAWLKQQDFSYVLQEKEIVDYYESLKEVEFQQAITETFSDVWKEQRHYYLNAVFTDGSLFVFQNTVITDEEKLVIKRFANVFNLTYKRFLDLQKAEAQAREAQIEAALERVRSKAMAMHKSEDLNGAVAIVFEELDKLDLGVLRCGISVLNREKRTGDIWVTSTTDKGAAVQISGDESFDIHPLLQGAFEAWMRQEDYHYVLEGDDLTAYYKAVKAANFELPESQMISSDIEYRRQYAHVAVYHAGGLFAFRETEFSEEAKKVMKRFANVFDLTYKRFLDIQKAEAQAREAKIEASLERLRSRTMAMHQTSELQEVIHTVHNELLNLQLSIDGGSFVVINKDVRTELRCWGSGGTANTSEEVQVPHFNMPFCTNLIKGIKSGPGFFTEEFSQKEKREYFKKLFEHKPWSNLSGEQKEQTLSSSGGYTRSVAVSKHTAIFIINHHGKKFSEDENDILKRFAKVFEQSYTRYLDLQNAEAQAREAQIEAALEKVRSRSLAMHHSDEMLEVIQVVANQLQQLNIKFQFVSFGTSNQEFDFDFWMAAPAFEQPVRIHAPYIDNPIPNSVIEAQKKGLPFFSNMFTAEENKQWIQHVFEHNKSKQFSAMIRDNLVSRPGLARSAVMLKNINIFLGNYIPKPYTDEENEILKRFANVFEQSYIRFLDLQKAEENAREAKIEAALEKVRGKAMAMSNSEDLSAAASTAFTELRKLGINPIRFGVGLLSKESRKALLYSAVSSAEGDSLALVGWVMLTGHPVLEDIYQSWLRNEDVFPELSGTQLKSYYEQLLSGLSVPSVPDWEHEEKQYGHFFPFSVGCLYAWAEKPFNEAEIKILRRFASIIDLTFRRYMDLQKSEANAREAVKQAALDRVRAEIASMRKVNDLDRITPLIWNELTILGLPFARCGVFIMDDEHKLIHTFLSTPDGKAIGAFHLPYTTGGNIPRVLENWQTKSIYTDHWDELAFTDFANELVKQGALNSTEQYLSTLPKGGFYLHFLPFLQGMLYVGSLEPLSEEQIKLVQAVADAFSTAYARYEDFNKLEAAKKQVEETLVDLRQTQQQLVQSEKMASLGEMTAGIAHEIQNPLNFVNNFSEVSNELLEEMKQELATGNGQLAIEIASDVKLNLEKILHHGKRADAIVKSMLQHSRSSSGKKELTDINALADEYLRLAYHGLRAKDKSFNAKFESHLDNSIGKINVVPQEIGRVILNLINNAFYAVTEKKKSGTNGYEPEVIVTTKNFGDKISISVNDNGNGIPQKVLDKIFQPFFTTKPTGQGTGLGLSLSYDIITKGHGGELKVETHEGKGTSFIILLPNHQAS